MAAAKDNKVHRLTDMRVEEVSLVDRGANGRTYLLVKRDETAEGQMLVKCKKCDVECKADATKCEKCGGTELVKSEKPAETEKAMVKCGECGATNVPGTKSCKDCGEKLVAKAEEEEDEDDEDDDDDDEEEDAEKALTLDPDVKKHTVAGLEKLLAIVKGATEKQGAPLSAVGSVAKQAGRIGHLVARDDVAKAGRKMAKARLEKLKTIVAELSKLLKELDGDLGGATKKNDPTPPPAAPAPATVDVKAEVQTAIDAALSKMTESLATVAKSVAELAQVVQGQGEFIAKVKKSTGVSHAIAIEDARANANNTDAKWPMDMSREVNANANKP